MPIETTTQVLLSKAKGLATLRGFVTDELGDLVLKIGGQEVQAALKALSDVRLSSTPRRELETGLTLLRLAQRRFMDTACQTGLLADLRDDLKSFVTFGIGEPARLRAAESAMELSLLLATAYRVLDEMQLVEAFIQEAFQAYDCYAERCVNHARNSGGQRGAWSTFMVEREREKLSKLRRLLDELSNSIRTAV